MIITTQSVEETLALGRLLGQFAPNGSCLALDGQLGAGKTQLTRGIAQGAGVDDVTLISSPTYVLLNVYRGPKPVYHLDAYRIASAGDFAAIGFEELLADGGIVVVEWAEKVADLLPTDCLRIAIEHGGGGEGGEGRGEEGEDERAADQRRTLELTPTGPQSRLLAERLLAQWQAFTS